jgi:hypothetical protein
VAEGRVVRHDLGLHAPHGLGRFDAQLLAEPRPQPGEGSERLGPPAGAVEGHHQLGGETLPQGVLADQALELTDELVGESPPQIGVEAQTHGFETKLLEPPDLGLGEGLVGDVLVRPAPPQRQPLAEHDRGGRRIRLQQSASLLDRALEPPRVELVRADPEQVARRPGQEQRALRPLLPGRFERGAEVRHVHPQGVLPVPDGVLAPQLVDDAIGRHDLVRVDQQQCQH